MHDHYTEAPHECVPTFDLRYHGMHVRCLICGRELMQSLGAERHARVIFTQISTQDYAIQTSTVDVEWKSSYVIPKD